MNESCQNNLLLNSLSYGWQQRGKNGFLYKVLLGGASAGQVKPVQLDSHSFKRE